MTAYCIDEFRLTFAAFRLAKTHCRVTSVGASFTATGACGREGQVAKHPWAYAPGPKPLNARTRKPYLVLGQRPRTQNCIAFCVRGTWAGGARRSIGRERDGTVCSKFVYFEVFDELASKLVVARC